MSAHLSQLVLDELAAGVSAPEGARAHVEGCADCARRLEALEAARAETARSFGYARVKARVTAPRQGRWRELMPFIVPAVASLVFFAVIAIDWRKRPDAERLKGGPYVELLLEGRPVSEARPGQRLALKLGTAGKAHALVLAVDKDRHIEELWSGRLPPGAVVTLDRPVEVTPGSVVVHAFLGDAPPDPKVVVPALQASLREYAGWPLEAPAPSLQGLAVASARLYVRP